jgi:3-dehydroquinate dehydratase-1
MAASHALLKIGKTHVVGSFGDAHHLREATLETVSKVCDIAELRLDILHATGSISDTPWRHLQGIPLLFTARRQEEGGVVPLSATERMALIEIVLDEACLIDIEVASLDEMAPLIQQAMANDLPWVASFHDFAKLPDTTTLERAAEQARLAGASAFKLAAFLDSPTSLARLAEFQLQDHGLPVATMGMGPLAPISRLLCAQCGSVLNYGYIGTTPTAPGQWDAGSLKQAITRLAPLA